MLLAICDYAVFFSDRANVNDLVVVRDKAWIEMTSQKLKQLFEKILLCRAQQQPKSRLALAKMASCLLKDCNL